ncbi:hypothetical protein ABZ490_23255 [Streptomyces sp. NPDC005811]|uniref:hypothetical protein n=1 Tax=Streptomyces sp. NPDC005811 TaxID=3154565 RepID=UPI0033C7A8A7
MRVPVATMTACALAAVLLVAGRSGAEENGTPPETGAVLPATEDQGLSEDLGPETVPEIPDLPDGGGLVPDGPDESDTTELVDGVALN